MAAKLINHRVHREHRGMPLFSVYSELSVVIKYDVLKDQDVLEKFEM